MMNSHHNNQENQPLQPPKEQDKAKSGPVSNNPSSVASSVDNASSAVEDENRQFRTVCFDKSPNIRLHASRISLTSVSPNAISSATNPASSKRNSSSASSPHSHAVSLAKDGSDQPKRARLDPSVKSNVNSAVNSVVNSALTSALTSALNSAGSAAGPQDSSIASALAKKTPGFIRRFRSRSLPIINYNQRHFHHQGQQNIMSQHERQLERQHERQLDRHHHQDRHHHHQHQRDHPQVSIPHTETAPLLSHKSTGTIPPLPPINLQSLKEIDLYEILKNPQLRHDILFDPQLQFRPNLDGERGKRKKSIIDRYWMEIQRECEQFFVAAALAAGAASADSAANPTSPITSTSMKKDTLVSSSSPTSSSSSSSLSSTGATTSSSNVKIYRLPILFTTLRDILLSLLPAKDRQKVNEIMDIELMVQQLNHGSFDFVEMSEWLANVFKSHCAPMRDQWVVEMHQKFLDAYQHNSVDFLVSGLRLIFQILEAMKLDVANHQIRVLRPVLIETAVDFERDYFQTLITHQKININDSLSWLYKKFIKKSNLLVEEENEEVVLDDGVLKPIVVSSIIDLLSCRQMATEFPSALAFDHTRLVLLRADVRQLVCVQLCIVLYKQLAFNARKQGRLPASLLSLENVTRVQQEILAIVTDDNGNVKWTKNISAISLQLVKNVQGDKDSSSVSLPRDMIEFSYNWLIKHIQPNSEVYGLMEGKIFKDLIGEITSVLAQDLSPSPVCTSASSASSASSSAQGAASSATELKSIAGRIATLVKFHWSVFRSYYVDYIRMQHHKIQQDRLNKRNIVLGNHVLDTTSVTNANSSSASKSKRSSASTGSANNASSNQDGTCATVLTT